MRLCAHRCLGPRLERFLTRADRSEQSVAPAYMHSRDTAEIWPRMRPRYDPRHERDAAEIVHTELQMARGGVEQARYTYLLDTWHVVAREAPAVVTERRVLLV